MLPAHTISTKEQILQQIIAKIPVKIHCSEISLAPTRNDFLNPAAVNMVKTVLSKGSPIIFMPVDVRENDWGNSYVIEIHGIFPCGTKARVDLEGVPVYFDVMVPPTERDAPEKFTARLMTTQPKRTEMVQLYQLHGFQTEPVPWMRLYFRKLSEYRNALQVVQSFGYQTAHDDSGGRYKLNYYYRVVARDFRLATSDWNRITKYRVAPSKNNPLACTYILHVNIADYKKLSQFDRARIAQVPLFGPALEQDPMIIGMWDIETYKSTQDGLVPSANNNNYTIFMMGSAYAFHYTDKPFLTVNVVHCADTGCCKGTDLTIVCDTERDVLIAHAEILSKISPSIMGAFNGACFDWPIYLRKLTDYGLLKNMCEKILPGGSGTKDWDMFGKNPITGLTEFRPRSCWYFAPERVKISAEISTELACVAYFPGIVDTDVSPVFHQIYPRSETGKAGGLNFYLTQEHLPLKADMPYLRMFKIYERSVLFISAGKNVACHCNDAQAMSACAVCCSDVKEIDHVLDTAGDIYTAALLPDIAGKCCRCGKYPRNLADMAKVGKYCVVDCLGPLRLYKRRTITFDKREISTLAHVTLYDAFYRAGGMKVRNLVGKYCNINGIAFSNRRCEKASSEKDHYPGGWVFPPERGLHNDYPVAGMDFTSLYPSLMMAYNLSPDMVVYTQENADKFIQAGYSLHRIQTFSYERGEKRGKAGNTHTTIDGWTVRHNGVTVSGKGLAAQPKIITGYEKSVKLERFDDTSEIVTGEAAQLKGFLTTDTDPTVKKRTPQYQPVYGRPALAGERMGICAYIVKKIFDKRTPVKALFIKYKIQEELLIKEHAAEAAINAAAFLKNKANSKQNALKLIANTFYGEMGNFRSPMYELLVAAGITCAGQENIKKVEAFARSHGHVTKYGDTDSLYLRANLAEYTDMVSQYQAAVLKLTDKYTGVANVPRPRNTAEAEYKRERAELRIVHWTALVKRTMAAMNLVREQISDFLLADNGTRFLNMAYEEVCMPVAFCGKKKYFMLDHQGTVNFAEDRDILVKGIETVKQGQAAVIKSLGEKFMKEALSPANEYDMYTLAEIYVDMYHTTAIDPALFKQAARYKPNVKNVWVQRFVERMKITQASLPVDDFIGRALYEPPEAGDKFEYIIAEIPESRQYALRGTLAKIGKGDKMEYLRTAIRFPDKIKIDKRHYAEVGLIGLLSRFIAYHPSFQPGDPAMAALAAVDKKIYKLLDGMCVNEATKHLTELCDFKAGINRATQSKIGSRYRTIGNRVEKAVVTELLERHGTCALMLNKYASKPFSEVWKALLPSCSSEQKHGQEYLARMHALGFSIEKTKELFEITYKSELLRLRALHDAAMDDLFSHIPYMEGIADGLCDKLVDPMFELRKTITDPKKMVVPRHILDNCTLGDDELQELEATYAAFCRVAPYCKLIAKHKGIFDAIKIEHAMDNV